MKNPTTTFAIYRSGDSRRLCAYACLGGSGEGKRSIETLPSKVLLFPIAQSEVVQVKRRSRISNSSQRIRVTVDHKGFFQFHFFFDTSDYHFVFSNFVKSSSKKNSVLGRYENEIVVDEAFV